MLPSAVWYLPSVRINLSSPSSEQNFYTFGRNILPPDPPTPVHVHQNTKVTARGGEGGESEREREEVIF
jgi:hypothetical protein